jgi:hypothetical protein
LGYPIYCGYTYPRRPHQLVERSPGRRPPATAIFKNDQRGRLPVGRIIYPDDLTKKAFTIERFFS